MQTIKSDAPASPPEPTVDVVRPVAASPDGGFDSGVFRAVMRQFVGSVTVITTTDRDTLHGMTATAVCSVCADPPTILIVVNRTARTHPHIEATRGFTVNILAADQHPIAERFAGKLSDQFEGLLHDRASHGGPILQGAAAHLACTVTSRIDIGTHTVFIGQVMGGGVSSRPPLVYHNAQYGQLRELDAVN